MDITDLLWIFFLLFHVIYASETAKEVLEPHYKDGIHNARYLHANDEDANEGLFGWQVSSNIAVKRISIDTNQHDLVQKIASQREPVVITNYVEGNWDVRELWNPTIISKKISILKGVKKTYNPILYNFNPDSQMIGIPGIVGQEPYEVYDMTAKEFFKKLKKQDNVYYYFSKNIENLPQIIDDVHPLNIFKIHEQGSVPNVSFSSHLWMGANRVTAHCHYDSFHNFFVQIYGHKRFILFSPSEWKNLYIHPRLHPYYRQSQIDFASPNVDVFPNFKNAKAYEVLLDPGDVLYLPPYWFHHVTAMDLSISVNVWSDSEEYIIVDNILKSPLPFESHWNPQQRALAVRHYVTCLLEAIWPTDKDERNVVKDLLEVRYQRFLDKLVPTMSFEKCYEKSSTLEEIVPESVIMKSVNIVKDKFLGIKNNSILHILVGNFIEDLSNWAVGVENVGEFLSLCFKLQA